MTTPCKACQGTGWVKAKQTVIDEDSIKTLTYDIWKMCECSKPDNNNRVVKAEHSGKGNKGQNWWND